MHITLNTADEITETDRRVLKALLGEDTIKTVVNVNVPAQARALTETLAEIEAEDVAAVEVEVKADPSEGYIFNCDSCDFVTGTERGLKSHVTRSHKDEPKATPLASVSDEAEEEFTNESEYVPDEEPEVEQVPGDDEVDFTVLREQAVKTATELVAAGKTADVRKVLNEIGARRVSEIDDADLQRFLSSVA